MNKLFNEEPKGLTILQLHIETGVSISSIRQYLITRNIQPIAEIKSEKNKIMKLYDPSLCDELKAVKKNHDFFSSSKITNRSHHAAGECTISDFVLKGVENV